MTKTLGDRRLSFCIQCEYHGEKGDGKDPLLPGLLDCHVTSGSETPLLLSLFAQSTLGLLKDMKSFTCLIQRNNGELWRLPLFRVKGSNLLAVNLSSGLRLLDRIPRPLRPYRAPLQRKICKVEDHEGLMSKDLDSQKQDTDSQKQDTESQKQNTDSQKQNTDSQKQDTDSQKQPDDRKQHLEGIRDEGAHTSTTADLGGTYQGNVQANVVSSEPRSRNQMPSVHIVSTGTRWRREASSYIYSPGQETAKALAKALHGPLTGRTAILICNCLDFSTPRYSRVRCPG